MTSDSQYDQGLTLLLSRDGAIDNLSEMDV